MAFGLTAFAEEPFSFAVVGDTQTDGSGASINWSVFPAVVDGANAQGASFLLVAGDLVGGSSSLAATVDQWGDFRAVADGFSGTVLPVPGNHDVYGGAGTFDAWRTTFPELPQDDSPPGEEGVSYYVDHGDVRFVFVTSDHPGSAYAVSADGLSWLDDVLTASADRAQVFVVTHHPVSFSAENSHGGTGGDLWQLLVAHGVTGLFTGHWHRYQPGRLGGGGDTWETILGTGGGWQGFEPIRPYQQRPGFVLVEVDGAEATATFFGDEDGDGSYDDPLDRFVMASATPAPHGLRARYTFDDGTADDSAPDGRAVHGTLEGGARITEAGAGPSGAWLDLSGSADFVEAGSIGDYTLALHGDLTLSSFVRVDEAPTNATWGSTLLCYATNDHYGEDEETNYAWWLSVLPDGTLLAFWEHGDGNNVSVRSSAQSGILDGAWHHVAAVRERATQTVRFTVDGEPLGEPVGFDTEPTGGSRGMVYLGSDTRAYAGDSDLVGALDEVCIFDLVLDDVQLAALAGAADCSAVLGEDGDGGDGDGGADTGSAPDTQGGDDATDDAGGESGSVEPAGPTDDVRACGCGTVPSGGTGLAVAASLLGLAWRRRQR